VNKVAFITGITGQDGSFLSELLVEKGYEVHGLVRLSTDNTQYRNIEHILNKINIHNGDLSSETSIERIIDEVMPDEIYNLGGITNIKDSFSYPLRTIDVNTNGFLRILESVMRYKPEAKVYQASSSEIFGKHVPGLINEKFPMNPDNPYGCSKYTTYMLSNIYKYKHNLHISNGILFNHESERRDASYVTRKITQAAARITYGKQKSLELGNINSRRDWGYAKEYCEAMWLMLQQENPDNYVIGTGQSFSVKDFLEEAFSYVNLDPYKYLAYNKELSRSGQIGYVCADARKAKDKLSFVPKTNLKELVGIMMKNDLYIERK
jgi:GDPmannose 4,6-dehydratase